MPSHRQSVAVAMAFALAVGAPGVATAAINEANSLATADAPVATGRLDLVGGGSACGAAKTFPGFHASADPFSYDAFSAYNDGPARCVTVTLLATNCASSDITHLNGLHVVAYDGTFDPVTRAAAYLGDPGVSVAATGASANFSMNLAANQAVSLVVSSVHPASTAACDYTLTSSELSLGAPPAPATVPSLSEWALMLFGGGLTGLALALVARRSRRASA